MKRPSADLRRHVEAAERAGGKSLGIRLPEGVGGPKVLTTVIPKPDPPSPSPDGRYAVEIEAWRPYTLNQLMRGKLRTRMALGALSRQVIGAACQRAGVAPATVKRRVSLVVGLGPSRREFDVDAPWKGVLDSLKSAGAIRDDSVRWCEIGSLSFYRREDHNHTTIILEDVEPKPCE